MKKRTRRKYTHEFKKEAVKLITNQGCSYLGNISPKRYENL